MLEIGLESRRKDFALLQCIRSKLLLIAQELYLCHPHQHLYPTAIPISFLFLEKIMHQIFVEKNSIQELATRTEYFCPPPFIPYVTKKGSSDSFIFDN